MALLDGRTILIVENDPAIGLDLRASLFAAGAVPVGPRNSVKAVLLPSLPIMRLDAAILDIRLNKDELVFPVADTLQALRVPYVFAQRPVDGPDAAASWRQAVSSTLPSAPSRSSRRWRRCSRRASPPRTCGETRKGRRRDRRGRTIAAESELRRQHRKGDAVATVTQRGVAVPHAGHGADRRRSRRRGAETAGPRILGLQDAPCSSRRTSFSCRAAIFCGINASRCSSSTKASSSATAQDSALRSGPEGRDRDRTPR